VVPAGQRRAIWVCYECQGGHKYGPDTCPQWRTGRVFTEEERERARAVLRQRQTHREAQVARHVVFLATGQVEGAPGQSTALGAQRVGSAPGASGGSGGAEPGGPAGPHSL
jgi:hypothetical protein